jgi:hypothetical protein
MERCNGKDGIVVVGVDGSAYIGVLRRLQFLYFDAPASAVFGPSPSGTATYCYDRDTKVQHEQCRSV